MGRLSQELKKIGSDAIAENGTWLINESAIVADNNDPENQHRIRVIIPTIDENLIFDEWARPSAFCLGDGFGSVFIPPVGSEVLVTGRLGQKYNLSYVSTYNEEHFTPAELDKNKSGIKSPKDLYFIASEVAKILAQDAFVIAQNLAKIQGENVKIEAAQSLQMNSNQIQVQGATVTINSDGSLTIQGNNISISGNSVTIHGRVVNKIGGAI